jgi:hypothetical protein
MPNKYRSNVENILRATIDGTDDYNKPLSNVEKLLVELKDVIESGGSSTSYATSLSLTIDSSTYVMTAQLLNKDGEAIGITQTIDLPLESMVVSGSYDSTTKKVILTLKNSQTVEFSIADLIDGLASQADLNALTARVGVNETNISLQQDTTAQGGNGYAIINGGRVYFSDTAPTGTIPTGSIWIGG